ncbi:unnamed protein product [Hymenolepis diminuta]|uniref:LEA_2 domain-containing protein n=1 Tax=Hymenolepis diminuta TaxID=6216 RepID=A0A0R3SJT1_HYMDI|nr:unnamed protein product [Hymenolepis diminuta]
MKSGVEFGILRKDLTSPTPQQTLCRKVHAHDLVLNNEECVSTNSCQGQYCFTEVTDHVPRKSFVGMAKVAALELREAPGKKSSTLINQQPGVMTISKPQPPAHVIPLPPHINQFRVDPRISNSRLFRHRRKEFCQRKWLIRVGILLAVILILTSCVYQICAWTNRWQKRRSLLLVQQTPVQTVLDRQGNAVISSVVNITICNANPFRGSAIFDLPSGSYLYDTLSGIRTGSMKVPDFAKELSKQSLSTLIAISHHFQDMLKR